MEYYIYEWYNKDTEEVFYVGKGKNNRYKTTSGRNQFFINYYNKYNCNVRKVLEGLTEKEAYEKEIELIAEYRKVNMSKCNLDSGGLGGNTKLFISENYKRFYYATLRINKSSFGLSYFELRALAEVVDSRFGMTRFEYIHEVVFGTLSESEIIEIAEEYCELADGYEDEYCYVEDLVEDGAYFSHDDFWEHQYKF